MLGYLLYLFVLADHLLASNRVMLDTVVSGVDNKFTECAEPTVTTDSEQGSVKERMIFTKIIFTLRPKQHQQTINNKCGSSSSSSSSSIRSSSSSSSSNAT